MKTIGRILAVYGIFLIVCGVAGYLTNPAKARSALISGGAFGALALLWSFVAGKGISWARTAGFVTALLVLGATGARAVIGWNAVAGGDSSKTVAATLVTLMAVGSLLTMILLARAKLDNSTRSSST